MSTHKSTPIVLTLHRPRREPSDMLAQGETVAVGWVRSSPLVLGEEVVVREPEQQARLANRGVADK